ncbi:(+)-neomenthol dehydrogenase-like [Pyrus communis]|uniref:(+)-neomenthol dehydrogenase-like n=1 Tax=Pyrus communis TaxID=23211 RepID=UPI0035C1040E
MAEAVKRYAVVTGANKGIGFGTVKQLASKGVVVVLTARDEKRGLEALDEMFNYEQSMAKEVLSDAESITEERIEAVLSEFLEDYKHDLLETKGWSHIFPAYKVSKAALNAYTRILAKKYPNFCINCGSPGLVKTDMNFNLGVLTIDEGAESIVSISQCDYCNLRFQR